MQVCFIRWEGRPHRPGRVPPDAAPLGFAAQVKRIPLGRHESLRGRQRTS